MVHKGQGGSRTRGIRYREAALDGEQIRRVAFKNKLSVNSVNALKLGQGVGRQMTGRWCIRDKKSIHFI